MLYINTDVLLKVALNTNKTDHHFDILLKVALNTEKNGHQVIHYN
jgi:hypothetical protein